LIDCIIDRDILRKKKKLIIKNDKLYIGPPTIIIIEQGKLTLLFLLKSISLYFFVDKSIYPCSPPIYKKT
ncbi:MAG TPA: hypothetical protein VLN45_02905, partial [Ignavibacteriaceae bacterium]|nr:hypothetical protein [Ignavibacteriaceae bacterium]